MDAAQPIGVDPADPIVTHVSDTALWVAAVRARESARPDAVFQDPLAAKLAGTRGRELAASMPLGSATDYALTLRTTAIDRLLAEAFRRGAKRVVNLFAELSRDGVPTVLLTEGLIAYLDPKSAADLARDMRAAAGFRFWILDYRQGKFRNHRERRAIANRLHNAPFKFNVENPKAFFGALGWRAAEDLHILDVGESIGRNLPIGFPWSWFKVAAPALFRRLANRTYGYVLFEAV